MITVPIKLH